MLVLEATACMSSGLPTVRPVYPSSLEEASSPLGTLMKCLRVHQLGAYNNPYLAGECLQAAHGCIQILADVIIILFPAAGTAAASLGTGTSSYPGCCNFWFE